MKIKTCLRPLRLVGNEASRQAWLEIGGWYGMLAVLAAYFLLSLNLIAKDSPAYLLLNASGSLGIILDAWKQKNYQPALLNLAWFLIAAWGIANLVLR